MAISKRDADRLRKLTADIEATRQARHDLVVEVFQKGATLSEISRESGMSSSGLRKMLANAGVREPLVQDSDEDREAKRQGARKRWDT